MSEYRWKYAVLGKHRYHYNVRFVSLGLVEKLDNWYIEDTYVT